MLNMLTAVQRMAICFGACGVVLGHIWTRNRWAKPNAAAPNISQPLRRRMRHAPLPANGSPETAAGRRAATGGGGGLLDLSDIHAFADQE